MTKELLKAVSPLKILLIEDDLADAELIEELLGGGDRTLFRVQIAHCLEAGVKSLWQTEFDVILLDLNLPDSFGLDTIRHFKVNAPKLPIVVLSALNDQTMAIEAVRCGAQDYLIKQNFQRELLVRAIHYAIERQRTAEAIRLQAERERLLARMIERIRASLDLEEILQTTVKEVRQFLEIDRVAIYTYQSCEYEGGLDGSPHRMVEAITLSQRVIENPSIYQRLAMPCLLLTNSQRMYAVEDVSQGIVDPSYHAILLESQITALLMLPILQRSHWGNPPGNFSNLGAIASPLDGCQRPEKKPTSKLWGLLMAHHCSGQRQWQNWEIAFLKQLAAQVAIAIEQSQLYHHLAIANQKLHQLATTDGLTNLANRRWFDEVIHLEWQRAWRDKNPLSIILCDIDFFKLYNDTYGHVGGDRCLQEIARAIISAVKKPTDLVARYGGEEFAIILPETNPLGAFCVAQKISDRIAKLKFSHQSSPISEFVTLSMGIASSVIFAASESNHADSHSPQLLIQEADRALYQAKANGRNRICQTVYNPLGYVIRTSVNRAHQN